MPPFAVTCLKCSPKDLDYLKEHPKLYHHKLFQWALVVKIRDKHKCRMCTALNWDNNNEVQAHHIFPLDLFPELEFIVDNGLTLCEMHHRSLHYKQFDKIKKVVSEGQFSNPFSKK